MVGYVTIEEATKFLEDRYDISDIDKVSLKRALHLALDKIECLNILYSGRNKTQELHFPRKCKKEIPYEIKVAQILEAYSILKMDEQVSEDQEQGVASRSINDMSISYTEVKGSKIGNISFNNLRAKEILFFYVRKTYDWS